MLLLQGDKTLSIKVHFLSLRRDWLEYPQKVKKEKKLLVLKFHHKQEIVNRWTFGRICTYVKNFDYTKQIKGSKMFWSHLNVSKIWNNLISSKFTLGWKVDRWFNSLMQNACTECTTDWWLNSTTGRFKSTFVLIN
jgi:hypothetical protein